MASSRTPSLPFPSTLQPFKPHSFPSTISFPKPLLCAPIGDCLVFDDDAFDQPHANPNPTPPRTRTTPQNLVPEKWKDAVAEINLTKKQRRAIANDLRFGSKVERRRRTGSGDLEEFLGYRKVKLSELRPVLLDDPVDFAAEKEVVEEVRKAERVEGRNPRVEVEGKGLGDVGEFLNSREYVPGEVYDDKKSKGSRKLFTKEEKVLLNKRIPSLEEATSRKWLPVHSLSASGDFFLLNALLKHNVEINARDTDGLSAIHKAIIGKKQAILNYLLRESANPFIRDNDGATLLHYAVQTASSHAIKILILYNVDVNLADNDGWTPLHLAVQARRTDVVKLLLIKGADKTLRNKDGLTPLDLCLYSGRSSRTYEMIEVLKMLPKLKQIV